MKQLAVNDNNLKDLTTVLDAALKAGGLSTFDAVNRLLAWIGTTKEEVRTSGETQEVKA